MEDLISIIRPYQKTQIDDFIWKNMSPKNKNQLYPTDKSWKRNTTQ